MALEIIPLEIFGRIINHLIEDEQDTYVFKFYNKDGINITPATSIYTDEEEQIDELSTQVYYGVYIHPISQDGKLIFKFEYLNNIYTGVVDESDTRALNGIVNISFVNQTVEDRLLPIPTEDDIGKVPVVQSDLTYGLEEGGGGGTTVVGNTTSEPNQPVLNRIKINNKVFPVDNFISSVPINDKTPYLLRTTAGGNDVGSKKKVKAIVGATVAWNQLLEHGNFDQTWTNNNTTQSVSNGIDTATAVNSASISAIYVQLLETNVIAGHKYLIVFDGKPDSNISYFGVGFYGSYVTNAFQNPSTDWAKYSKVLACTTTSGSTAIYFKAAIDGATAQFKNAIAVDLTKMFGSTIADYVYTLDTAQAGSGLAWLKSYGFVTKDFYSYSAGTLTSVKTSANETVGFNLYDNTTGKAVLIGGEPCQITGTYTALSYVDFSGNSETITPNINGYFTPTNNGELTVTGGNATDTCVHFVYDGERDGEWEAYVKHSYALDGSKEWRGIYKLDANNNIYADGDIYVPDGTVTRKYPLVDLGEYDWSIADGSSENLKRFYSDLYTIAPASNSTIPTNIKCVAYNLRAWSDLTGESSSPNGIYVHSNGRIFIRDTNYSTAEALKTALSGTYLLFEAVTPTTESADTFTEEMTINDWGTEEFVDNRTVALPVGHNTDYEVNLKAKLEMTPNSPDTDGLYLVQHINGVNKYIQYVSPVPDLPSSNGTYTLKVTVSGSTKTVSWVSG